MSSLPMSRRGYHKGIREQLARNSSEASEGRGLPTEARRLAASSRRRGGSSSGSAAAKRELFIRFADQAVSLSSGCQEKGLKGCCALQVCAEDSPGGEPWTLEDPPEAGEDLAPGLAPGTVVVPTSVTLQAGTSPGWEQRSTSRVAVGGTEASGTKRPAGRGLEGHCPFKSSRRLANASALTILLSRKAGGLGGGPGAMTTRWLYMHGGGGLYDTRYENLVVLHAETPEAAAAAAAGGLSNLGFGPLSLVRYASQGAVEVVRAQASSARSLAYPDVPEGVPTFTQAETFEALGKILQAYDFLG